MEFNSCSNCPYCRYSSYYSMNEDSGYDCKHPISPNTRIIDDKDSKGELVIIPKWCPLEEVK